MHIFLAIIAAGIVLHSLREGLDEWREESRDRREIRALRKSTPLGNWGRWNLLGLLVLAAICIGRLTGLG
jgi:hypothetical protein